MSRRVSLGDRRAAKVQLPPRDTSRRRVQRHRAVRERGLPHGLRSQAGRNGIVGDRLRGARWFGDRRRGRALSFRDGLRTRKGTRLRTGPRVHAARPGRRRLRVQGDGALRSRARSELRRDRSVRERHVRSRRASRRPVFLLDERRYVRVQPVVRQRDLALRDAPNARAILRRVTRSPTVAQDLGAAAPAATAR